MDRSNKTAMIITWCDADNIVNYGQVLQGCAMAKTVSRLGFKKVILLSYRERNTKEILEYFYLHHSPIIASCKSYRGTRKLIKKVMKQCNVEFHQVFHKKDVDNMAQNADVLICGSDQIWHPVEYNRILFLDTGRSDALRISYAASQPMSKKYPEYRKIFQKMENHLKQFDAISVREKGTVSMFEKMSGKPVCNVVDPTLLIKKTEWKKHAEPLLVPQKYVLIYIPAQMNKLAKDIAISIQKKTGIKNIVCLAPRCTEKINGIINLNSVSTGEFLYLIDHASYICTSSFHGVIFSILFEKEFWCFKWMFSDRRSDLRLNQITELAELENRLIKSADEISIDDKIDYEQVKTKMKRHILESYTFLESTL